MAVSFFPHLHQTRSIGLILPLLPYLVNSSWKLLAILYILRSVRWLERKHNLTGTSPPSWLISFVLFSSVVDNSYRQLFHIGYLLLDNCDICDHIKHIATLVWEILYKDGMLPFCSQ
eukprot:GHVQ01024189.1.p1 GENE.GHVQ01024189.1~~GHVQ01024189.1.p1  ORF type:complete len:117 (+),score=10.69 GHVQ01024189.1:91-441(+)